MKPYYDEGGIVIYCGDCLEVLPTVKADVVVSDVPYGIAHSSGWDGPFRNREIANDDDTVTRDDMLRSWGQGRPAIIFGTWKRSAPTEAHTCLVWNKGPASGMGNLAVPWKPSWEAIFVIGQGFVGKRSEGVLSGHTVVTWASKGRMHPNEKPVSLMIALQLKCPAEWIILDPFMGSGSTLVAAKALGRRAIGIELEERYCEIAARRLSQGVLDFRAPAAPTARQEPLL